MKVLVVGSGGREHAIIKKIKQNPLVTKIYCACGNGGISLDAEIVNIKPTDIVLIANWAKENEIDLTVVGMDDPLMLGIVDELENKGLRVFGPNKAAAIIEGSKVYAKNLMKKYNIPTCGYEVFDNAYDASEYLNTCSYPTVIKADGLALGKGVIICYNKEDGLKAITEIMIDKKFKEAGNNIVIEEFIEGPEVSVLSFCDGEHIIPMVSAQDHKRAYDNDEGPNTGGMGTFSPSKYYTKQVAEYCKKNIFEPTVEALKSEGRPFKGIIFFGLMLTKDGPKLLEYNARFGDPEAQVVLPRLKTDLVEIFEACIDGKLNEIELEWDDRTTVCVMLASGGYPLSYMKGYEIKGLKELENKENIILFHSGTKFQDGQFLTNGGRVLGVMAYGENIKDARTFAYTAVDTIEFKGMQYRSDIGIK